MLKNYRELRKSDVGQLPLKPCAVNDDARYLGSKKKARGPTTLVISGHRGKKDQFNHDLLKG